MNAEQFKRLYIVLSIIFSIGFSLYIKPSDLNINIFSACDYEEMSCQTFIKTDESYTEYTKDFQIIRFGNYPMFDEYGLVPNRPKEEGVLVKNFSPIVNVQYQDRYSNTYLHTINLEKCAGISIGLPKGRESSARCKDLPTRNRLSISTFQFENDYDLVLIHHLYQLAQDEKVKVEHYKKIFKILSYVFIFFAGIFLATFTYFLGKSIFNFVIKGKV